MVKKTITQLKRELESLKRKDKIKTSKLNKALRDDQEAKELENEIRELKRSPFYRKLRTLSKNKPTKVQLQSQGKKASGAAKSMWKTLGKVVNKLDKIKV